MAIVTKNIQVKSRGEDDVINITQPTLKAIKESNLKNGIVTVFVSGSTAAITTIEYEPGLRNDFPKMLNKIIPRDIEYEHDKTYSLDENIRRCLQIILFVSSNLILSRV
jgi:secondary thiamine-phosphate synthase enzyme